MNTALTLSRAVALPARGMALTARRTQQRAAQIAQRVVVRAETEEKAAAASAKDEEEEIATMESMLKSKRNVKRKKQQKPQVIAPAVQEAYGDGPKSPTSAFETGIIQVLLLIFTAILAEGVFIGASGFLGEDLDNFATTVVYPAFSPTVIVFLAISSFYGLFKTGKLPGQSQAP